MFLMSLLNFYTSKKKFTKPIIIKTEPNENKNKQNAINFLGSLGSSRLELKSLLTIVNSSLC